MLSWQLTFLDNFPLLIGYWVWCMSGAMALFLTAQRQGNQSGRTTGAVLADPLTLALFALPVANAILATVSGQMK
jgi:hypothetical protein